MHRRRPRHHAEILIPVRPIITSFLLFRELVAMAKRLSLPALRQRLLLRLNPKNTVPVNDCYRRLYTMSAGKVRRFGRTFPLNRCYSQLESVFSGKVFFALNIREALPSLDVLSKRDRISASFPQRSLPTKKRDCVCSLFLWRCRESNSGPNKAPYGFLHAYPAFGCREPSAGGRANGSLASET